MDGYATFIQGNRLTADFKNIRDNDGIAFNPPGVVFKYKPPELPVVVITNPDSRIAEVEVGWYRLTVDLPEDSNRAGVWTVVAQAFDSEAVSIIVRSVKFKAVSNGL